MVALWILRVLHLLAQIADIHVLPLRDGFHLLEELVRRAGNVHAALDVGVDGGPLLEEPDGVGVLAEAVEVVGQGGGHGGVCVHDERRLDGQREVQC